MASTALADVLSPTAVSDYVTANLPDHVAFTASGAAVMDFDALAAVGGDFINIRHFVEDTTADEVATGASASTPSALSSYKDIGVVLHRKRVRGVDDTIKSILGKGGADAVNNEIGRHQTHYWGKRMEIAMVNVLTGIFDPSTGPLLSTHVNTIAVASGTPVKATYGTLVDTASKLGDNMADLAIMLVPSKVWADLDKEQAAKANAGVEGQPLMYRGMRVFLTDQFGTTGSGNYIKYTTLLVRPGALFFAWQRAMQVLYQLEAAYPREILTSTVDYVAHLRGVKWGVSTTNPANTDLATASNWTKVATNNKEIGVVALVSNATP